MGDTPVTLSSAVLSAADIAESVELVLAQRPEFSEPLSANQHLSPAAWKEVLSHKPRVKVVANLCDRELDEDRIEDIADANEVRFRALSALEKRNGVTAEHAARLAKRRMPSGSAMLLSRRTGLDSSSRDLLARNLSPRAGVQFVADDPFGQKVSADAAFDAAVRRYRVSGAFRATGESAIARVMRRWPVTRMMALEFAASVEAPAPDATDNELTRFGHSRSAAVGLLGTLGAFRLDETHRGKIRTELIRLGELGAKPRELSRALANLIVSGRLAHNWDRSADRAVAARLGLAGAGSDSVAYQLAYGHRWQGYTERATLADMTPAARKPLSSLPVALWILSQVSVAKGEKAERYAAMVAKLQFVDQVGVYAAQWALDVLSEELGQPLELSDKARLPKRLRYKKVAEESDFDRSMVLDANVEDLLEALSRDHSGRIAASLGHAVASRLRDDLDAWMVFLGIVDDTCSTLGDAVAAANALVGNDPDEPVANVAPVGGAVAVI